MIKRLSMALFIVGSLIAILGGAFEFAPQMETLSMLLLIILGIFIGIINISREEEMGFLIAGGVFIIASTTVIDLLETFLLFDFIGRILENFIVFVAPSCIIVGFRVMVEFASQSEWSLKKEERLIEHVYRRLSRKDMIWDDVILFAVSITFIVLILQLFFDVSGYESIINIADWVIIAVFAADLVIIYRRTGDFRKFLRSSWLDIIAVIPLGMAFRLAKVVRFARILKFASKAQKASRAAKAGKLGKLSRINRPSKFFSDRTKKLNGNNRRK